METILVIGSDANGRLELEVKTRFQLLAIMNVTAGELAGTWADLCR